MAVKYIPYQIDPLRGQAVLPFLRYHAQLTIKDFILKGLPYYETELIEQVNGGGDNLVIHGDCLNACAYLKEKNIKIDLVYIDPPFASGANYAKKIYIRKNPQLVAKLEAAQVELQKQKAEEGTELDNSDLQSLEETMYGDIWQKEDYLNWIYERLLAIKEVMSETASIYVHLDWHIGHYVKVLMDEIFGEENLVNEIIWYYRRWNIEGKSFATNHDTLFLYSKNKNNYHFNQLYIPKSLKSSAQGKSWKSVIDGNGIRRSIMTDEPTKGVPMPSVWEISMLNPMAKEREIDYSTQKPPELLERIVTASSNKNMVVADFFGGSGVAAVVAQKLGRRFITADVGLNSIQTMRDRLVEAGAKFDILKIKDGIDLFRNPEQTMEKLGTIIPGLSKKHDYGSFWFGAMTVKGQVCPCWVPNLINKSQAILNAALFTQILDESAKLEDVTKIVICSVDKIEDTEIDKMISEYDLRDRNGVKITFMFKDLKELTDLLVYPDIIDYALSEKDGVHDITITRFLSDTLIRKINEFNAKKQTIKQQALPSVRDDIHEVPRTRIDISDNGLELIEYLSIDGTNSKGIWTSDEELKIDKKGYVVRNGEKTKQFWNGKITSEKKPLRLKVRNIAGDETIISL